MNHRLLHRQSAIGLLITVTFAVLLALAGHMTPGRSAAPAQPQELAAQAHAILQKRCTDCHGNGGTPPKGVNVEKYETLISTKAVVPKDTASSKMIEQVVTGNMPMGGDKLPAGEIQALRDWIEAGAPNWDAPKPETTAAKSHKIRSESQIVHAILDDLNAAPERDREYLRYYSIANLYNNPDVTDEDLEVYRTTLGKLLNSLSWSPDIAQPKPVDPDRLLLRIDLRDFDLTPAIWRDVVSAYPYGFKGRDVSGQVDEIQTLSKADVPYIRVDWFVANASVAPLYRQILQLPDNIADLEKKLGVDSEQDVVQETVARAGIRNSGVSHNNRVVERHRSLYGAYWRSFDYASNQGAKNIFQDPVDMHPDGGEFIFNLPNGMQAYYIVNKLGARLDDAPIAIVRDRTNSDDPVVHTGRSCISCHFEGMNKFTDEVRPVLETQQSAFFDLDKAKALYVKKDDMDGLFHKDDLRFQEALRATGNTIPTATKTEPIFMLAQRYLADVTVNQAAADAGLDVAELRKRISGNSDLERLGFGQLLEENGGFKRDAWEDDFGAMIEAVHLGDFVKPSRIVHQDHNAGVQDGRVTIAIGTLIGGDERLRQRTRQDLTFWLNQSDDLRVVTGIADHDLKVTLSAAGNDEVTIEVVDRKGSATDTQTGAVSDLHFLTQQLANRINFKLAKNFLPVRAAAQTADRPSSAAIPVDIGQRIEQAVGHSGPVNISLNVDRGPGAIYHLGEEVQILFKVDRDCSLTLYDINSAGEISLLFPNEFAPNNHVEAGRVYRIPDPTDGWAIKVTGKTGPESISAIATLDSTDLPGVAAFRENPHEKSLSVVRRNTGQFVQDLKQSVGSASGTSSAILRFFTAE